MKLSAQKRDGQDARSLRRSGRLPGIMYNKELNVQVSMDHREFDKVFRSQGTSHVIDLDIDGKNHEVLVKAVHMHKRRRQPQHVDFYAVTAGQEVDVNLHVDFVGTPIGVREGGQSDVQRREVQIRILPRYIPEKIEIDVAHLEIGQSVHVADIASALPKQATLITDPELTLMTVLAPKLVEEEETVAEEGEAEPEVIGRDEDEEGEAEEE